MPVLQIYDREIAYSDKNCAGAVTDKNGNNWIAYKGDSNSLEALELLPGAIYSKSLSTLLIPFTRSNAIALEHFAKLEFCLPSYKDERAKLFSFADIKYPSPVGKDPREPFQWQRECLSEFLRTVKIEKSNGFGCWVEMGMGKTRWGCDLIRACNFRHIFITCKRIAMLQWADVIEDQVGIKPIILNGRIDKRKEILREAVKVGSPTTLNIFITNWEAIKMLEKEIGMHTFDLFIGDESTVAKNRKAEVTATMYRLANSRSKGIFKYKVYMSGSPMAGDPNDVFGQYKFLNPSIFGGSATEFTREYCNIGGYNGVQVLSLKEEKIPQLISKMYSIAYRAVKASAFDMPPKIFQRIDLDPGEKQGRLYKQLANELFAIDASESGVSHRLDVTNSLTKMLRLQQITSGIFPYTSEEIKEACSEEITNCESNIEDLTSLNFSEVDNYMPRLNSSRAYNLIDSAKTNWTVDYVAEQISLDPAMKILVWGRFRPELQNLVQKIAEKLGDSDVVDSIHGSTPDLKRHELQQRFNDRKSPLKVLVGNIKAMGYSMDLPAADLLIYHSNVFSYSDRAQSEDRGHRAGRTRPYNIIDLCIKNTVDSHILRAVRRKMNLANLIVTEGFNRNSELPDSAYNKLENPWREQEGVSMKLFEKEALV